MMNYPHFDNDWYTKSLACYEAYAEDVGVKSDTRELSRSIRFAGCVIAEAIQYGFRSSFISPNVADSNGENANTVDSLERIAHGIHRIATHLDNTSLGEKE